MLTFFLLCVALVAVCHLTIKWAHRTVLWCTSYCWIYVMGLTAKPKPPVPPKPVLRLTQKPAPQKTDVSVGHNDTSKSPTKENHAATTSSPPNVACSEPKKPSVVPKPDKNIVRGESVESSDEACCSNLSFYICHKGPKNVARQVVAVKPKPPAKPPKPSLESLARARAARRSVGDEIPAGKEGFKYVDDTSTESSNDYKDIVFNSQHEILPTLSSNDPSHTENSTFADWEPLETSSRQSDRTDIFTDDVFTSGVLVETKNVQFLQSADLNATFDQVEATNYSVYDPVTSSKNPATVRHSWPRRNKKKKIPPKRPPPPKNYQHLAHSYCSLSDDERNRSELSPDSSPILPRSTVSNADLSSKGNHGLTADGRYYRAGDKLSFYPYASSVQSHFMKTEDPTSTEESQLHSETDITSTSPIKSENLISSRHSNLSEKESTRFQEIQSLVSSGRIGTTESTPELLNEDERISPRNSQKLAKGTSISCNLTDEIRNDSLGIEASYLKDFCHKDPVSSIDGIGASWPRRTKPKPPRRPPPPVLQNVANVDHIGDSTTSLNDVFVDEEVSPTNNLIKPPRPPLPHNLSPKSSLLPNVPPRTKRKRSRTVEITPSMLQPETTSRQRSYSLHDDPLTIPQKAATSIWERKSLYTSINKDPDRKKKPMAEPQVYDRMRFRPLPAPPPPPRKISKGKLDMLPSHAFSDINLQFEESNMEIPKSDLFIAAKSNENENLGSNWQQIGEKSSSPDIVQYRSEVLKQYSQRYSKSSENEKGTCSPNQIQDKFSCDDISKEADKVQLGRYETIHNLYKEIKDKTNCCDSNFLGDDKGLSDCSPVVDSRTHDISAEKTCSGENHDFLNNNEETGQSVLQVDGNCNLSVSTGGENAQGNFVFEESADLPNLDGGLHKTKKLEDLSKKHEKVGSPRLLRREEILSSYGVLAKKEIIPQETIGEMLATSKKDLSRQGSNQSVHSASGDDAKVFLGESNHKQELPRQESAQSMGGDDADEKEVFAIEVFVSSETQSTKGNSHNTSLEVESLDNSYCVDENANVPEAAAQGNGNKQKSPKSLAKKSKAKAKRMSQSTFYCPANSEDHSRSSSPQRAPTAGDDSEVSGNIADVDSSAGSSGRDSAEREDGKRRSSTFYTESPIKLEEKSVQTFPQDVTTGLEDHHSEDTDELMDIARDIKKELSLIIERHRKVQDGSDIKLGSQLLTRKAVSSTQSSASEFSCQGSSAESDDEHENPEEKKAKKLFFIAREIMTSEESFVNALRLLNEDFRQAVEDANKEKGVQIVPDDVLNNIFRFLPQLQNLNQSLLEEIKERIDDWQQLPKIADVIVKVGPFLKLYSCYIRDFETMTTCLDEACRKYPLFGQIVKEFEASPGCHKLALKHYLLKPVQRIPQYRLLLQDYLNHLSSDSLDYEDTTRALQIVSEVANHANETMKQGDNFLKLMSIQNSLLTSHEIIKPGRLFLKEGELLKLSRKGNQPRWFILFNDSLMYLTPVQQGIFRLNHELPLTGMRVSVPMQNDYENEFSVISVTRSFSLAARTPDDREEWITALTRAIEENAVKRSSFINMQMQWKGNTSYEQSDFILGKQAPVWIPDSRVTMCQLCTTEFTITYRRHHCRACGRVICSQCSANRAFLKYLDRRSARVCDNCFLKLQEEEEASKHKLQLSESESDPNLPIGRPHQGKQKRPRRYLPSVLKEVCANDQGSTISGYLYRLSKKRWKRFWFVLKDKVLYTYKASEDVAAKESIPVLGYTVETFNEPVENVDPKLAFHLHHPNQPFVFYAETVGNAERWVKAMREATVLE